MYFFKTRYVVIWSEKMMFNPCINVVYRRICLNNLMIIDNEVH